MATIPLDLDGYTDLPGGRIASIVTYLEMHAPPAGRPAPAPADLRIARVTAPTVEWYRGLYRRIGERWLWFSRFVMDDTELAARLSDPKIEIHALYRGQESVGLAEIDRALDGEPEIAMFGVVPESAGTGAARYLMDGILAGLWGPATRRVWLHTCTLDHPAAIPFYRKVGFTPFKLAIEVARDPRLTGAMPREAGPHIPLIEG